MECLASALADGGALPRSIRYGRRGGLTPTERGF
jgi:hypothetical protein